MTNDNSGYIVRQRRYPKTSIEIPRSLEMDEIKINVVPTSSKVISAPTMVRLYLPPVKPSRIHATLPLRFGRDFQPDDTHSPKSTLNLPQRFGRSQASGATIPTSCSECSRVGSAPSATLPQRFGRKEFYRRYLFRAMACFSGIPEPVPNGKVGYQDYSYYDLDSDEEETGEKTLKRSKLDLLRWSF
ncbi:pro-FMRFamide-related neuropeptide VF isoform X1 [Esox lucius]|nr:pro-FMRFamide-related neuropeptide VF isoform X1 [Esox lucius]